MLDFRRGKKYPREVRNREHCVFKQSLLLLFFIEYKDRGSSGHWYDSNMLVHNIRELYIHIDLNLKL